MKKQLLKSIDINILKHEILSSVIYLNTEKKQFTPEMVAEQIVMKKLRVEKIQIMATFSRLQNDGLIEIQEFPLLQERWFIKGLTDLGLEAFIHKTFIKEFQKERRANWNETGQILSPFISVIAVVITAVLFTVDKCSEPSSYEVKISGKVYRVIER